MPSLGPSRRSRRFLAAVACLTPLPFALASATACAQPATAEAPPAAGLTVPVVPEGTPAELFAFVEEIRQPKVQPKSREQMMTFLQEVSRASVQAADKILAQVKADEKFGVDAAKLKLESLMMLGRLGDEQAAKDMAAYAATLTKSPSPELAEEAERLLIIADAQKMFADNDLAAAPAIIQRTVAFVAAHPDDVESAMLAMQLAGAFEHAPEGEALAAQAYGGLAGAFAKSTNPQIKQLADSCQGTLRRLSLTGKPMAIKGTLLDGSAFDPASLAGKVVLVDFWATWCGPCVAEIPNMLAQYEKYHDKGFEVVGISLDDDREALAKFIDDKKIPWPILHEAAGGGHPLATFYGITGIPQLILIGRDGNVITLNARGEALGEKLAELFKDAG
jgi:thiol-disulfide isomerase/thioredoxin